MNYFDTSALIKAFLVERGTDKATRMLLHDGLAVTATITYAEMHSGFSRKRREGGLSAKQYDSVCEEFESYWQSCLRIELTSDILTVARDLIKRHPLRAFDAIHLGSALRLKKEMAEPMTLIAADDRLLQAAQAEELVSVNVESA